MLQYLIDKYVAVVARDRFVLQSFNVLSYIIIMIIIMNVTTLYERAAFKYSHLWRKVLFFIDEQRREWSNQRRWLVPLTRQSAICFFFFR